MKKVILFVCSVILSAHTAFASGSCFIVKENGKVLKSEGDCAIRLIQGCDFSILLSLMGFDSGILKDENTPTWEYNGEAVFLNAWKKSYTPRTWIVDSCVWYSDRIVGKLGEKKIKEYIHKFEYGNQDTTGINKNDWPSALRISPNEQVDFLQKILNRELPISKHAYEKTENILFIQDMIGGWKLYGKTGMGEGIGEERIGWLIGWIAKNERRIPFASCIIFPKKQSTPPSFVARNKATEELFWIINDLEK
jgi:beta-lactamase class D